MLDKEIVLRKLFPWQRRIIIIIAPKNQENREKDELNVAKDTLSATIFVAL